MLEGFCLRNNIKICVLCSESASADSNMAEYWKTGLREILKGYSSENQSNVD